MTYGKWWRVEGLALRGTTFIMLKVLKFFKLSITFKTEVSLNLLPIKIQKACKIAIKCFNHQRYQRPQNKTKQFIQKFFPLKSSSIQIKILILLHWPFMPLPLHPHTDEREILNIIWRASVKKKIPICLMD